jgi:hypothetical protein
MNRWLVGWAMLVLVLRQVVLRLGPAVVTATGVVLVVGGLLTYDATAGSLVPTPHPTATPAVAATFTPLPTIGNGAPAPSSRPGGQASRIVIPAMNIDLPVVPSPDGFPYCNVAQSVPGYTQPGLYGSTFILGHARVGMFLPLLEASQHNDGASMLGVLVQVYTSDSVLYLYEIDLVARHQLDNSVATLPKGVSQQLVLTTSEGDRFHKPKLMIRARFLYSQPADPVEANPVPHPVICY